jgi:hypothetical protein
MARTALFSRATTDPSFSGTSLGGMRPLPVGPAPNASPSPSPYTWQSPPTAGGANGATISNGAISGGAISGGAIPGATIPGATGLGMPSGVMPGGAMPGGPVSSAPIPGGPVSIGPGGACDCNGGACAEGGCCPGGPCCDPCCGACCDGCCGCWGNNCCYPGNRFYVSGEYLLWWLRGSPVPPLVTAGSAGDAIPGALGSPGTEILFGGRSYNQGPLSGGRFFVGYWFGPCRKLGIELGGFFLGPRTTSFSASSNGAPGSMILARPFIDAATGNQTVEGVAGPGVLAGTVSASIYTFLWGTEANLRSNICCGPNYFIDGIAGFRNVNLYERLRIDETLNALASGGSFVINDTFQTHNNFYGGQLGLVGEARWGRWSVNMFGKVALGVTQQVVNINGSTLITPPGGTATAFPGGLLTQPSNIGHFSRDVFGVVPEAGVNLGYQLTPHLRTFIGYNFLYWNNVVRPGQQIDLVVNTNQIPPAIGGGPARPAFSFQHSDFWAQGITFGLEFRY